MTTPATTIPGLQWWRVRRFTGWSPWHIVDVHGVALCGRRLTGTNKQTQTYDGQHTPTELVCLPCTKHSTATTRQTITKFTRGVLK